MPKYLKTGELDTRWCAHVTCPHCGWEDYDSWEYDQDYVEGAVCGNLDCGKEFDIEICREVTYTTTTINTEAQR